MPGHHNQPEFSDEVAAGLRELRETRDIAAAEAAVALAIVIAMFRNFNTVRVDEVDRLRQ